MAVKLDVISAEFEREAALGDNLKIYSDALLLSVRNLRTEIWSFANLRMKEISDATAAKLRERIAAISRQIKAETAERAAPK